VFPLIKNLDPMSTRGCRQAVGVLWRWAKNMKIIALIAVLAASVCVAPKAEGGAARLTKGQVYRVGREILKHKNYRRYSGRFDLQRADYDDKTGVWSIPEIFAPRSAFPAHDEFSFFEIRDSDGSFRIGTRNSREFSRKSLGRFRMSPSLRATIRAIVEDR
jgi:hypothetical protein